MGKVTTRVRRLGGDQILRARGNDLKSAQFVLARAEKAFAEAEKRLEAAREGLQRAEKALEDYESASNHEG